MPTVILFIVLAILLAVALAFIVLIPWLRRDKSVQNNQLIVLNVAVFQERLQELKTDYDVGKIDNTVYKNQKTELERQLLQASEDSRQLHRSNTNPLKPSTSQNQSTITANVKETGHNDDSQTYQFTQSKRARFTILTCIPLLMGLGYAMAADRTPIIKLWNAQDTLGQVADDLLTGKIEAPPEWATTDNVALLGAIQTNVHQHAHDPERWMRLADIFLAFKANEQALEAMARAYRLAPTDEAIAVRYAQTQFFTSNGMLNKDSYQILESVLQANPKHQGAQMLMAMGEARSGNYDRAQSWINTLRAGISQRPGDHSAALQSLDKLSQNIAQQKAAASMQPDTAERNSLNSSVNISVSLNTSLLPLLDPNDTLYVTVKEDIGGAPLAAKKLPVDELKTQGQSVTVALSDDDAMMPTRTISAAMDQSKSLVVTARVSKSGQAIAESGDLTADLIPLKYSDNNIADVNIEINQQVP